MLDLVVRLCHDTRLRRQTDKGDDSRSSQPRTLRTFTVHRCQRSELREMVMLSSHPAGTSAHVVKSLRQYHNSIRTYMATADAPCSVGDRAPPHAGVV